MTGRVRRVGPASLPAVAAAEARTTRHRAALTRATRRTSRRRIAVVTGTRAEYGVLRSTIAAIAAHPQLDLQLVVTGMHLLCKFGHTVDAIRADGWPIAARVPMQRGDDDPLDQAEGLARGVAGLARCFARLRPDVVLVLGDRIEALAGALAAVTTGCVLAHVHGGDVAPGDFDDSLRHSITKLAHLHFAATKQSAARVRRLGEDTRRVFCVGAPGLDELRPLIRRSAGRRSAGPPSPAGRRATALEQCDVDGPRAPFAVIAQHAHGRSAAHEERLARAVFDAVARCGLRQIITYPNTDRGHSGVLRAIAAHARRAPRGTVVVAPSLPREVFVRLLAQAAVLVGNSSAGIIEAPFLGTPVVNVGTRQAGREPGGPGIIHVAERRTPAATTSAIAAAIRRALHLPHASAGRGAVRAGRSTTRAGHSVYGDGGSGARIARLLARIPLSADMHRKQITY